jgi:hypothetical protein
MKRAKWKLTNKAIEIIVENGGQVFGGAVRDKYLHDVHSRAFYAHVKTLSNQDLDGRTVVELYQDKTFRSDLNGRFVIPKDIDAQIHHTAQSNLINALQKSFPCITKLFSRDIKRYFPNLDIEENTVVHFRYAMRSINTTEIHQWLSQLMSIFPVEIRSNHGEGIRDIYSTIHEMLREGMQPIYLDLMVNMQPAGIACQVEPPFGNLDFMCNALILDKHGYQLSTRIHPEETDPLSRLECMLSVMKDIQTRTARVDTIVWYRIRKMMKRKWKVEGIFSHIEQIHDITYTGHCLICHEPLTADPQMKLKCCDARYHPRCLQNALVTGDHSMTARRACVMCSQNLPSIATDSTNLTGYLEHNIHLI